MVDWRDAMRKLDEKIPTPNVDRVARHATNDAARHMRLFMKLSSFSWGIAGASAFAAYGLWMLNKRLNEPSVDTKKIDTPSAAAKTTARK